MISAGGRIGPASPAATRHIERLPGPSGDWFIGSLRDYQRDKVELLSRAMTEYGDMVLLRIGRQRVLLVSDPARVMEILVGRADEFRPGASYRELQKFLGRGLVTTSGEVWQRHRTALQPLFRASVLGAVGRIAGEATERLMTSWRKKPPPTVEIGAVMRTLTMDITMTVLFGPAGAADLTGFQEAFDIAHHHVMRRLESFFPFSWPAAKWRFSRATARLDAVLEALIAQARISLEPSLLTQMLAMKTAGGQAVFSDEELRDECLTLLLAGFETTATALTWVFYLLARHTETRLRVARGDADWTSLVIREALRLFPPVWAFSREAAHDTKIAGYQVPKRTKVAISPFCIHRSAKWWQNPEEFRPERFSRPNSPPPQGGYLPFGLGARQCLGQAFALSLLQKVVLDLCAQFRLDLVRTGERPGFEAGVFLKPRGGILMTVCPL